MLESQEQFPYFLPTEIVLHNLPYDCWLSCLGGVYDLTEYVTENSDSLIGKYLLAHGGKDVSHWFDPRGRRQGSTARLKRYVDTITGEPRIFLPFNTPIPEFAEVTSPIPRDPDGCYCSCSCSSVCISSCGGQSIEIGDVADSPDAKLTGKSWLEVEHIFNGSKYQIGWLTKKARPCKITNVLTGQQVCEEDSIKRIQERALVFNLHGASYTWKFEGKPLDPSLSLTENGIADERDLYLAIGLPDDATTYIPNLLCYYNDDLTEL